MLSPTRAPELDFEASGHLYATHRLHAYAARCPPPLARWAIETHSREGDVVLDPMVGSGTTMVEACLTGRQAWGADIDPLARLIAKVKATPIEDSAIERGVRALDRALPRRRSKARWPDLPNAEKWFREDVAKSLDRLRRGIESCHCSGTVRDFLWVAFSSLIVSRTSVANARDLVHSRHHFREWIDYPEVDDRFMTRVASMRRLMSDYRERLKKACIPDPDPWLVGSDARSVDLRGGTVDLIATSPPYVSALDYPRAHMFAVAWMERPLGISVSEYRNLGRRYVGTERGRSASPARDQNLPANVGAVIAALSNDVQRSQVVMKYFLDMQEILNECHRLVKLEGRIVLIVCPSNIRKVHIKTQELLASMAKTSTLPNSRLRVLDLYEREIHDRRRVMPYLESSFGPRMRTEYVLVLERARR